METQDEREARFLAGVMSRLVDLAKVDTPLDAMLDTAVLQGYGDEEAEAMVAEARRLALGRS
jgi:hypothetical protein